MRRSLLLSAVGLLLALAPVAYAEPIGSQPVTPLIDDIVDGAPYVFQPGVAPVRDAIPGLREPAELLLRGAVVTMDEAHTVIPDGNVLVVGHTIRAVWAGTQTPAGVDASRARVVDAGPRGLIFPGLINLHDHPSYAALPLAPPPRAHAQPAVGRPLGVEPYANRYQWGAAGSAGPVEFARRVENPQHVLTSSDALGLYEEVLKHAEARSVLGGVTAIQGERSSGEPAVDGLLARNVSGANFGRDRVDQRVASVGDASFTSASTALRHAMAAGALDAWLVHLGEGVRDSERRPGDSVSSRHEFERIKALGVLTDATVILHGVGLEPSDFAAMRAATGARVADGLGAKLVWSPFSNLLLYGRTASVYDALAAGVAVSLGTDWTPSGSNNLLGELKVADIALRDARVLAGGRTKVPALRDEVALDRLLVDMVTRNPARALRWAEAGTVAAGKVADLVVINRPDRSPTNRMPASPYRSLIDASERDVRLVVIGGEAVAGDVGIMRRLRGRDFEIVRSSAGGYAKAIDVTNGTVPHGSVRLAKIENRLSAALRALGADDSYLRQRFDGGRYALTSNKAFRDEILIPRYGTAGGRLNLEPMRLHPLLTEDDGFFFGYIGGDARAAPYASNVNFVTAAGNPFAPDAFYRRWFAR